MRTTLYPPALNLFVVAAVVDAVVAADVVVAAAVDIAVAVVVVAAAAEAPSLTC